MIENNIAASFIIPSLDNITRPGSLGIISAYNFDYYQKTSTPLRQCKCKPKNCKNQTRYSKII